MLWSEDQYLEHLQDMLSSSSDGYALQAHQSGFLKSQE